MTTAPISNNVPQPCVHDDLKHKTVFLAEYAATLEAVGTQTSRIRYNTARIAAAWGYWCNIMQFTQTASVTLHDEHHGHSYTYVKRTPRGLGLNFTANMELSHLSWQALDERLTLEQVEQEFRRIMARPRWNRWLVLLLVTLANACFCRLFEGNLTSMCIVAVATMVGFFLKQEMMRARWNELAIFVICSFVSTMIGSTDFFWFHGGTEDMSLGTSMLYLVPGVPIINGVMDLIDRHVLNGLARLTNALLLVACIATGLSVTLLLTGVDPLTFTHVTRPDVWQAACADGLFAAVAGLGFAIISNPPRKALLATMLLACVGHGVRYLCMHHCLLMLDQASASTLAGFVVGLLALPCAWRLHYPAECFAFPALLPMVPGLYAYKALRDLINIVQQPVGDTMQWVTNFAHNSTLTILVMVGMVAGCVVPIFMFRRQAFQVTRASQQPAQ